MARPFCVDAFKYITMRKRHRSFSEKSIKIGQSTQKEQHAQIGVQNGVGQEVKIDDGDSARGIGSGEGPFGI